VADRQPGLVVRLDSVRNALWQSQFLGRNEPRERVIARVIADTREGFHAYRPPAPRRHDGPRA